MIKEVENYHDYLTSYDWQYKRNKRIAIDQKCQICGRPFNLHVHHMTYKNVPDERTTDLITLCKFCHRKVEDRKGAPWYDSFGIVNEMICRQFINEHKDRDYSAKGDLDFCKLDVIKRYLFPYMKEHGANLDRISGTSTVLTYFRNRRYEIILNMKAHGATPDDIFRRYKFSTNMVYKVYKQPEVVARILSLEDQYAET